MKKSVDDEVQGS